jgi:hypothetical protein
MYCTPERGFNKTAFQQDLKELEIRVILIHYIYIELEKWREESNREREDWQYNKMITPPFETPF